MPLFVSTDSLPIPRGRARRSLQPSLAWCYLALAPAMIFILAGLDRSYQTDLWHHLARGREMLQNQSLLNRDVFTFTLTGQPIVDNNWLTQIAAAKLYAAGGIGLLQPINALLLSFAVAFTVSSALRLGSTARTAGLTAAAMVGLLAPTLLIRPQTVSILLFALLLRVLIEARVNRAWLVAAPLIVALWANVHGAFPVGVALIACFAIGQWERRGFAAWLLTLAAAALAMLVNPYGYRIFAYVRQTSTRSTHRSIQEWLPPDLHSVSGIAWLASVIAVLVLAIDRRKLLRPWMTFVLIAFAGLSCTSVRMGIWWSLSAGAIMPAILSRRGGRAAARERVNRTLGSSLAAAALLAVVLIAGVFSLPAMARFNPIFDLRPSDRVEDSLAVIAADITRESPNGRVFSRLEWGEYLSFALPWQASVFLDGRIEIVPDDVWEEYRDVTSAGADWQAVLDRYHVNVLVLDRHYHDGLIAAVGRSGRWRKGESAGTAVIFYAK